MTKIDKVTAQKLLNEGSCAEYPKFFQHLQSIVSDTLPQYYLDSFKEYKTYSDDLPGITITRISLALQEAINDEIIQDRNIMTQIMKYRGHKWNAFKGNKPTPKEIQLINNTLDIVISHIEETYFA